jgi:hypothetical protein
MNFDDRLARRMKAMGDSMAGDPLDFSKVLDRARIARRRHMVAVAAAVVLVLAGASGLLVIRDAPTDPIPPVGPGPESSESPPETSPDCSASAVTFVPQTSLEKLPAAVEETRTAIIEAATACDYDTLAAIGLDTPDGGFAWSVGDPSPPPPQRFWRSEERLGTEPLGDLVRILNMDFVEERYGGEDHYVWPTAQRSSGPTSRDFAALVDAGVLSEREAATMEEAGSYLGWRVSIAENGDWEFFTAGD